MNPDRKARRSRALDRGQAMHCLVLDGDHEFARRYMRGAVHTEDMTPAEKGAETKKANMIAAKTGREALYSDDYDRIITARKIIELNPDTATAFRGGFSEVTVIWERDGIRLKARIDYLKPTGIGDLKGADNIYDQPFDEVCLAAIRNYRYDMQAALYLEGRDMIEGYFSDGAVYGDHDHDLLRKVASQRGIGWQWVFFCQGKGPPDAASFKMLHGNDMLENAKLHVELALARYTRFRAEFGTDQWFLVSPVKNLTLGMMPPYWARLGADETEELHVWNKQRSDR
jgi:hypothetical protein